MARVYRPERWWQWNGSRQLYIHMRQRLVNTSRGLISPQTHEIIASRYTMYWRYPINPMRSFWSCHCSDLLKTLHSEQLVKSWTFWHKFLRYVCISHRSWWISNIACSGITLHAWAFSGSPVCFPCTAHYLWFHFTRLFRDCSNLNIMMDPKPLYPRMYHPVMTQYTRDFKHLAKYYSRTARPTKYYFVDFGISRKYKPSDAPFLEHPIRGGDKSVPEFRPEVIRLCNPFPTDLYYLGHAISSTFLEVRSLACSNWCFMNCVDVVLKNHTGVEFVAPLVADMMLENPSKRPTMTEVVDRFSRLRTSLGYWKLRSRLIDRRDNEGTDFVKKICHFFWTITQIIFFRPPIPRG